MRFGPCGFDLFERGSQGPLKMLRRSEEMSDGSERMCFFFHGDIFVISNVVLNDESDEFFRYRL